MDNKADCYEPVCEKSDIAGLYKSLQSRKKKKLDFDDLDDQEQSEQGPVECPLDRDSLGFFSWNFLHTVGIYYPDKATEKQQEIMKNFIAGFTEFYPCKHCKTHFQADVKRSNQYYHPSIDPVKCEGRKDLSLWLCYRHNEVNKLLGKKTFPCEFEELERRWKTGHPQCKQDHNRRI